MLKQVDSNNKKREIMLKEYLLGFAKTDEQIEKIYKWYKGEDSDLKNFDLTLYNVNIVNKKIFLIFEKTN